MLLRFCTVLGEIDGMNGTGVPVALKGHHGCFANY